MEGLLMVETTKQKAGRVEIRNLKRSEGVRNDLVRQVQAFFRAAGRECWSASNLANHVYDLKKAGSRYALYLTTEDQCFIDGYILALNEAFPHEYLVRAWYWRREYYTDAQLAEWCTPSERGIIKSGASWVGMVYIENIEKRFGGVL